MSALPLSISVEEIIALNVMAVNRFGGTIGPPKLGCLEQCRGNAELAEKFTGNEDGSLGLCFIGSLMFYLIKDHCFMDGNKRTGLAVALRLLYDLGLTLNVTEVELTSYCEDIADNRVSSSSDVVRWISERLIEER